MIFKKIFLILFFVLTTATTIIAQIYDDFEDNDLSSDPEWIGDHTSFAIEGGMLRSDGPLDRASIAVATKGQYLDEQEWQLYLRLEFAPSGANKFRWYLLADSAALSEATNSIYLEIGQTGSDRFRLLHKSDEGLKIIFESNRIYTGPVEEHLKVIRTKEESWILYFADEFEHYNPDTSATLELEEDFDHNLIYSGLSCYYTSTRRDKFFFDDFYSGPFIVDVEPPKLSGFKVSDNQEVVLNFTEAIDPSAGNFLLNEYDLPENVLVEGQEVNLIFNNKLSEGENKLSVGNISDLSGNILQDTMIVFNFFKISTPKAGDILINEIMPDPSPPVDLPEVEYIELWNRSGSNFDLKDFQVNGRSISTESIIFQRNSYAILCREADEEELSIYGNVAGMDSWDVLSNAGDVVMLTYKDDQLIDEVGYANTWYKSIYKNSGGFSLERKHENWPCVAEYNWEASEHEEGGTPGTPNSLFSGSPDIGGPKVEHILAPDSVTVIINFNEPLNTGSIQLQDFTSDDITFSGYIYGGTILELKTLEPFQSSWKYEVEVEGISDCFGNQMYPVRLSFVLPEAPNTGDIIINEVLFDPYPSGVDFLELYNNSKKHISLQQFSLSGDSTYFYSLGDETYILAPEEHVAVTIDSNKIVNDYPHSGRIYQVKALPAMPNDGGEVFLFHQSSLHDQIIFSPEQHLKFLTNIEGVSLERISVSAPSIDPGNWHSAASTSGFATPGKMNSQSLPQMEIINPLSQSSLFITPNQDGEKDFVIFKYNFDSPGYIGTFSIYDPFGKKIIELSNNAVLGKSGQFQWDGTSSGGQVVRTGQYILLAEIFSLSGESIIFKEKVAVIR